MTALGREGRPPLYIVLMLTFWAAVMLSLAGCNEDDVQRDMARFDRAFVPALALTSERDTTGQSLLAVKRLRQDWEVMKAKYSPVFTANGRLQKIDSALEKADSNITVGEFQKAHDELEAVRWQMMEARQQYGVEYFLDYLSAFNMSMQGLVKNIEAKKYSELTPKDIEAIQVALPELKRLWEEVETAPFDAGAFLFSSDGEKNLKALIETEKKNIEYLDAAIKSRNLKLIHKHTMLVKKGFSDVFSMFGDFDSVSL